MVFNLSPVEFTKVCPPVVILGRYPGRTLGASTEAAAECDPTITMLRPSQKA
jgi:hypothetical protein